MFDLFRFLNDKKFIEFGGFWMAEQAKKVIKERKHQTVNMFYERGFRLTGNVKKSVKKSRMTLKR